MKKILGYFIATAFATTSISLASCGDDEDDDDDNSTVVPEQKDTTNNVPSDTTNNVPNEPSEENPSTPEETKVFTIDDVQGVWHINTEKGAEEYIVISGESTHIIRLNTEYPVESDKWLSLKFGGTNVTNNVLGFSPSYLTSTYGYKLKSVTEEGIIATPKNQYFEDANYNISDVKMVKVNDIPEKFKDEYYIFQFSMDYTEK